MVYCVSRREMREGEDKTKTRQRDISERGERAHQLWPMTSDGL